MIKEINNKKYWQSSGPRRTLRLINKIIPDANNSDIIHIYLSDVIIHLNKTYKDKSIYEKIEN